MTRVLLPIATTIMILTSLHAQQSNATPVFVDYEGTDTVGRTFAYELRDVLAASKRYPLASVKDEAVIVLVVRGVDVGDQLTQAGYQRMAGLQSALAITVLLNAGRNELDKHVSTGITLLGKDGVSAFARQIVTRLDQNFSQLGR